MSPEQNDNIEIPTTAAPVYDPNDPLAQDVGSIDTSFPKLAPGLYDMEVVEASVGESRSTPGNQVCTVRLATIADAIDTKGETLNKGFPVYYRFGITPTADYTAKAIATKIASLLKHCGFVSGIVPRAFINDPDMIVGKVVRVKIGLQKETAEYPESNVVKAFVEVQ